MPAPLAFGLPGGYEVVIIGFVALLIFGNRLPTLMRSLGQGVTEFKKGINGVEDEPKTHA
jgi:sec-independent protein translocase protein TatA